MKKIKVNFTENQHSLLPKGIKILLRRAFLATLTNEGFEYPAEVNVTFVEPSEIKELNSSFRKIDSVTDVLSFPLSENGTFETNPENGMKLLGDVVICLDVAIKQAEEYGHSLLREICFLAVHSYLHLLGYDHIIESEGDLMRAKEKEIMSLLKIER